MQLIQEWLVNQTNQFADLSTKLPAKEFQLLAHCTEKTSAAGSLKQWQQIYAALGQKLAIQSVGCCGMSGTYGHEAENLETSKKIYELSWAEVINADENQGKLVATGYSCRSQVKRMDDKKIPHPSQALLDLLRTHR